MERQSTSLLALISEARGVLGDGSLVTPLILLRLRQQRPEDAEALREMTEILRLDSVDHLGRPRGI